MRREASKKSRGISADEKRFQRWVKEQPCCVCHRPGPSIADHVKGSAYKIKYKLISILVGHWYVIPLCLQCDTVKTSGSHRAFLKAFNTTQNALWIGLVERYEEPIPEDVIGAIKQDG